jgi:5-methylcytosine-specific restriction protein B
MVAENIDEKFKFSKEMAVKLFKVNSQRQKDTYYFNLGKEFKKFKSTLKEETVEVEKLKNFVLIIDEINRGNISKIFGELITLIEESKRLGNTEQLKVKLPYSGEEFGVPKNLYVIGTMNTADRSIALMDTALRRRFQFEEMMPKSEKVPEVINTKNGEIELRKLFETINERIEYLYDRDHTIGHSYFMDVKTKDDLDIVFKTNVIPLLQEYFYDDWEKIQIVLGDHFDQLMGNKTSSGNDVEKWKDDDEFYEKRFILSRKIVETLVIGFDHDEIEDDKKEYRINEKFSIEAYKKIYAERINE